MGVRAVPPVPHRRRHWLAQFLRRRSVGPHGWMQPGHLWQQVRLLQLLQLLQVLQLVPLVRLVRRVRQ